MWGRELRDFDTMQEGGKVSDQDVWSLLSPYWTGKQPRSCQIALKFL